MGCTTWLGPKDKRIARLLHPHTTYYCLAGEITLFYSLIRENCPQVVHRCWVRKKEEGDVHGSSNGECCRKHGNRFVQDARAEGWPGMATLIDDQWKSCLVGGGGWMQAGAGVGSCTFSHLTITVDYSPNHVARFGRKSCHQAFLAQPQHLSSLDSPPECFVTHDFPFMRPKMMEMK